MVWRCTKCGAVLKTDLGGDVVEEYFHGNHEEENEVRNPAKRRRVC